MTPSSLVDADIEHRSEYPVGLVSLDDRVRKLTFEILTYQDHASSQTVDVRDDDAISRGSVLEKRGG
jgi:hypothetical protein